MVINWRDRLLQNETLVYAGEYRAATGTPILGSIYSLEHTEAKVRKLGRENQLLNAHLDKNYPESIMPTGNPYLVIGARNI